MQQIRINIKSSVYNQLLNDLDQARSKGDIRWVNRIQAILAWADDHLISTIASILKVDERTVHRWIGIFLLNGPNSLKPQKSPGRPPKLTKTQKKELDQIITKGPAKAGFPGACWRSPMIQDVILKKFGKFYSAHYISQLLKDMGFSYQKATFVAARRDRLQRKQWLEKIWPSILKLAKRKNALIFFEDESSFPQWGTLSYTWAKQGKQPMVKTSGNRRSYKIFGLIEYFSGQFFSKGHEGRLNSSSYIDFLKGIMKQVGNRYIILIHDGARYHTSAQMRDFYAQHSSRLHVEELPTYSPDFNPIEKLWKKIKEKDTHLHYFPTFDSLKKKVNSALIRFKNLPHEVLSLFGFYDELAPTKDDEFTINFDIKINFCIE